MDKKRLVADYKKTLQERHRFKPAQVKLNYTARGRIDVHQVDLAIIDKGLPVLFFLLTEENPLPVAKLHYILEDTDFHIGILLYMSGNMIKGIYGIEKDLLAGCLVTYREITDLPATDDWLGNLVEYLQFFH